MSEQNDVSERIRLIRWRMTNEESRFSDEIRLVPPWVGGLAVITFAGFAIIVRFLNARDPHPMPPVALIAVATLGSLLLACLVMLIGYVNRDAKRRGMNVTLWTLMAIFVPNALGIIIYFLVREPLLFDCPNCGTTVSARFNFCPHCKYNFLPTCPQCKREIRPGDRYCAYCACELPAITPTSPATASEQ